VRTAALAIVLALVAAAPAAADERLLGRVLSDAAITAVVKTRLGVARPASLARVDVDTNKGVVQLRGRVRDAAAWAEAQRIAEETPGVRRVWNELAIAEPGPIGPES
jgi:osmotically-inducible protein OsmY